MSSDRISPTAHYTGYTWYRNGLSHPALVTREGRAMVHAARPFFAAARRIGAPTLEGILLARHRHIDAQLADAIESGAISQVIEIAAGLSPRGWDFKRRFGTRIEYIEADLPGMAARKLRLLETAGLLTPGHRVVELDALADEGALSLKQLASSLDSTKGLAIITEGLINYFPTTAVLGMWHRFARTLAGFEEGLYLSDLHLAGENRGAGIALFLKMLSTFVRGNVHLHFASVDEATAALREAGFDQTDLDKPPAQVAADGSIDPRGAALVRVVRATTGLS
ncbi:MAG: class I SAM-dependent methyltransferase [Panacagrimonas sp.]